MSTLTKIFLTVCVFMTLVQISPAKPRQFGKQNYDSEVELNPHEICVLPMERGHCRALILRWRYDPETKTCKEFKYGGCAGNGNNFSTKKLCAKICAGI